MRQHPREYPINREPWTRCEQVCDEGPPGGWNTDREVEWCWEEIAQLQAALQIHRAIIDRAQVENETLRQAVDLWRTALECEYAKVAAHGS